MTPNNDKPSFLDRGTLIAFAIIMLFWFGWSKYMESKYPATQPTTTAANQSAPSAAPAAPADPAAPAPAPTNGSNLPTDAQAAAPSQESFVKFEDEKWSFDISSKGMGIRAINIKDYQTRSGSPIILGDVKSEYPFSTKLIQTGQPVDFAVEKTGDNTFVGRASVGGLQIEKTLVVDSATYSVNSDVKVTGATGEFKGVSTVVSDVLLPGTHGSIFAPSYDYHSWFVSHENTTTRKPVYKEEGVSVTAPNVAVAALSAHYFAIAVVDRSPLAPRFESTVNKGAEVATGSLVYQPPTATDTLNLKFTGFAGPKSLATLSQIDPNLARVVDYGMFAVVAKPILWLLKTIHSVVHNWGFAIIILTILVRLLVLPFNVYSFRSMKVMQKIQPEMTRIREKYKDKPPEQRLQMNQEIMDLMKRNKANPLGGCLPMLLQLPVFIALYQTLGQSIELYRSPFILWIHDLSVKDPYYVLPALMGFAMFVQQKITPTTMDPQQAKILMWMPVIFAVMMVGLPSGLTLYIFVSTLFGVTQQYVFMRDKSTVQTVKEAKA